MFEHDPRYIEYKEMIVGHPNYKGMPGAIVNGRIQWQVSSGRGTSFNTYYEPRRRWWRETADRLGIPGTGDEQGRFTVAARRIHPTGVRPCLHCGENRRIGYFYANRLLVNRLKKDSGFPEVRYLDSVDSILKKIAKSRDSERLTELFWRLFPERNEEARKTGRTPDVFENTRELKSTLLSPGYMGDPPDRLDGLHDYCVFCRKEKDPARHDERMARYNQDRRVFEWWVEGDWELANTLYNVAGPGLCSICGTRINKVSPDHVGPLSCGFKHMPFFFPLCGRHQAAKNRRMSLRDVQALVAWEAEHKESAASWQVRDYWDAYKNLVSTDENARLLSDYLRVVEDIYLRVLDSLLELGKVRFLVTLLNLEPCKYSVELAEPNPATLTFSSFRRIPKETKLRRNQPGTIVRKSLDALSEYFDESNPRRLQLPERVLRLFHQGVLESAKPAIDDCTVSPQDSSWAEAFRSEGPTDVREAEFVRLLRSPYRFPCDHALREAIEKCLSTLTERYPPF